MTQMEGLNMSPVEKPRFRKL